MCNLSSHSLYVSTVGHFVEPSTVLLVLVLSINIARPFFNLHLSGPDVKKMSSSSQQQRVAAAAAAASLVRTLNNPYNVPSTQPVNPQGYTYSSTYNFAPVASSSASRNVHPPRRAPTVHWYTPGNSRCTYPGCTFAASPKSLEIHMMDRHLVYPPGWHDRPRQSNWDTDPSLKGYALLRSLTGRSNPPTNYAGDPSRSKART
jgi:hypothetical protein